MTQTQVDLIDLPPGLLFLAGSLASLGILSLGIPFTGYHLSDTIYTLAYSGETVPFSLAKIMSLIGLTWALATNDLGWRSWGSFQIFLGVVTFGLVLSPPFIPILHALLMGSSVAKIVSLGLQMYGFVVVSYIG